VRDEYFAVYQEPWMRLHQDHVPVVDEDNLRVDYLSILKEALDLGYDSIMVDGSRLPLEANIAATRQVVALAGPCGVPVEAELGAVLGHEAGPIPPYEELFRSGKGFTDVEEAAHFVEETGVDWLSVACGNIHGAIQGAAKDRQKVTARLNTERLAQLRDATGVPLVLHGGSGIEKDSILAGVANGIAKINIGTDVRQPYEQAVRAGAGVAGAREAVYERACELLCDVLELENSRDVINPPQA
jgi:fructose/tagatose bisphosphate aldolase